MPSCGDATTHVGVNGTSTNASSIRPIASDGASRNVKLVDERRNPVFLEEDLHHVRGHLQQAEPADAVRAVAVLPQREQAAFDPDHLRAGNDGADEDHDRLEHAPEDCAEFGCDPVEHVISLPCATLQGVDGRTAEHPAGPQARRCAPLGKSLRMLRREIDRDAADRHARAALVVDAETPRVVAVQHDIARRDPRLDRLGETRQFLGAEVFVQRHQRQPRPSVRASARNSAARTGFAAANRCLPGSPPRNAPPTSVWNLFHACGEFQPGAHANGSSSGGRSSASGAVVTFHREVQRRVDILSSPAVRARTRSRARPCGPTGGAVHARGPCRACGTSNRALRPRCL